MSHALLAEVGIVALLAGGLSCTPTAQTAEPDVTTVELAPVASELALEPEPAERPAEAKPETAPPAVGWQPSLEAALERAARERRSLLVFVHADWSAASVRTEREAFSDARVRRAMQALVAVRLDVSAADGQSEQRVARLNVNVIPSVLLLDSDGARRGVIEGAPRGPEQLLELIANAGAEEGHTR